jgi:hypothetical protein
VVYVYCAARGSAAALDGRRSRAATGAERAS